MRVIGIVGWKNNGKTTLVCRLVEHFRAQGLSVATIKHAHHSVDIDQPGKDSYRHRAAGAGDVILATSRRWVHIHELAESDSEPPLAELLDRLRHRDLVIVEGFKQARHAKLEVHLAARGTPLLASEDPTVLAVISNTRPQVPVPVLDINEFAAVARFCLDHAQTWPFEPGAAP